MAEKKEILRSVAIVGRPNVGKSRLFNRLIGRRVSIVHDMPGVTRDLITEYVSDGDYLLMDTGGIGLFKEKDTPKIIADAVEEQVFFAVQAAEVILFVVDASQGCTPLDLEVSSLLRKYGKKVVLVVNKVDNDERKMAQADYFQLGFGTPILISAEHNLGLDFLKQAFYKNLSPASENKEEEKPANGRAPIKICLAGRPNVGKSSIGNCLLKSSRLIVSDVAGTTRDPIRQRLDYVAPGGSVTPFELVDTAGKRSKNKFDTLEYFSSLRTDEAMSKADVCFLVIDAETGVTRLDKQLAGQLIKMGTGLVVVVNKWDLVKKHFKEGSVSGYESESEFRKTFSDAVNEQLFFLPGSPVLFISALENLRVDSLLFEALKVWTRMNVRLTTGQINRLVHNVMEINPPRLLSGRRFKCYYALQTGNKPLRIRMFCNSEEKIEDSYERFLKSKFYDTFDLLGVPLMFDFVGKPKQEREFYSEQQSEIVGGDKKPHLKKRSKSSKSAPARSLKKRNAGATKKSKRR